MLEDPEKLISEIVSVIASPEIQAKLFPFKILFVFITLILIGAIFYIIKKTDLFKYQYSQDFVEFKEFKSLGAVGFSKKWGKIKTRISKGWETEAKLAIIEADQLLDSLLKRMGYVGENFSDRLKQIDIKTLSNIEQVWKAHEIRNNLVHDPDYRLSFGDAKKVVEIYEQTFKILEAL